MPKICGVPGCVSGKYEDDRRRKELGLRPISLFAVPKSEDRFKVWKNALKYNLKKTHYICQLHFPDESIQKDDIFKLPDGTISLIPRDHWRLHNDAVPLLLDQPSDQDKNNNVSTMDSIMEYGSTVESLGQLQEKSLSLDLVATSATDSLQMECDDIAENITVHDTPPYSIDDLKCNLRLLLLPEFWAWNQEGSDIIFTYLDRLDFSVRLHLVVHQDLSIHIRSISNTMIDLKDTVKSTAEILSYMKTMENLTVCKGTDIENERRDRLCTGVLDDTESYKNVVQRPRCVRCRRLRKKLLKRKKKIDLKKKYEESKKAAQLERRKNLRLLQKMRVMKANIDRLQAECAAVNSSILEEKISIFPDAQQEAIRACFEASKIKSSYRRRYTVKWIYECLLMRIKNSALYEHLRDRQILPLPCRKTLNRYIQKISSSTYGFHDAVFEGLRRKGSQMDKSSKRGVLLIDEMKLSEAISFDRKTMKFGGFVDLGKYTPENQKATRADHALVFMFQPFRGRWVQALGCFLSKDSVSSAVLHKLILECVILLGNSGFHVDAVTTDGAQWNRGVWNIFGIDENNLSCLHPCDENERHQVEL
ncbi:uncharacterized protein [Venturia canescens]|uniref:uncharacterized protein n=1 Tax=Venturia canescens TaxID=32260 RepID=UPI001C9BBEEA|nr:uncharacterized protein LOC122406671 [Venturia canescens]